MNVKDQFTCYTAALLAANQRITNASSDRRERLTYKGASTLQIEHRFQDSLEHLGFLLLDYLCFYSTSYCYVILSEL